jgi:hypothetical protein
MPGRSCCAAVHAYDFGHLGATLPQGHSHLERLPRLQSAEPDTSERGRMEEDISCPIRELDETVPFAGAEPFDLPRTGRPDESSDCGSASRSGTSELLGRWSWSSSSTMRGRLWRSSLLFSEVNLLIAFHATMRALARFRLKFQLSRLRMRGSMFGGMCLISL